MFFLVVLMLIFYQLND